MRSKEKIAEEIVLIRYYNVLFYLFFKTGTVSYTHLTLPTT